MPLLAAALAPSKDGAALQSKLELMVSAMVPRWGTPGSTLRHDGIAVAAEVIGDVRLTDAFDSPTLILAQDGDLAEECRGVIVRAFVQQTPEKLRVLPGPTSFVLWQRHEQRAWIGTDPFGARNLYYLQLNGALRVSSQVEGLLALAEVPRAPNEAAIAEHLRGYCRHLRHSFYDRIEKLQAGHLLVFERGQLVQQRYFFPRVAPFSGATVGDAVDAFRSTFKAAVRKSLGQGTAVVHLSGGLDSSSVAAAAAELAGCETRFVGAGATFTGLDCDETRYIRAVATRLPFRTEYWSGLSGDDQDLREDTKASAAMPIFLGAVGGGCAGDSDLAARSGLNRIATGLGGNQIAAEEGYLVDWARSPNRLAFLRPFFEFDPHLLMVPTQHQRRFFIRETTDLARSLGVRRWWKQRVRRPEWEGPALASLPVSSDVWATLDAERRAAADGLASKVQRSVWDELTRARFLSVLEFQSIRLSRVGMTAAHPYLDIDLADLVMSIPPKLRPWRTASRGLQRYALRGLLPLLVLRRRDRPEFSAAIRFHAFQLRDRMRRILSGSTWLAGPWVRREVLRNWLADLESRALEETDPHRWDLLRRACGLEVWLRREFG